MSVEIKVRKNKDLEKDNLDCVYEYVTKFNSSIIVETLNFVDLSRRLIASGIVSLYQRAYENIFCEGPDCMFIIDYDSYEDIRKGGLENNLK
jgi:hypothetical protein